MAKKISDSKLLDFWSPPGPAGQTDSLKKIEPISFISTTFTFDSEFFEEECLTRFLCMETEKENDGVAFLIEKEEKLAGLRGGIVIVDQQNCKGERSLRWDLVSCRLGKGVMHAKITILHWSNCIRLIIGSANLTKNGYCINQEIFGVIDYTPNGDADLKVIGDTLSYLENMISQHCGETIKSRFSKQQEEIRSTLNKWEIDEKQYRKDDIYLRTLFVSPDDKKDALTRLKDIWNENTSSPPDDAYITSPFFDSNEHPKTPSLSLFEIMKQRGDVEIGYYVAVDRVSENESESIVKAPDFLKKVPRPKSTKVYFYELDQMGEDENGKSVPRPIHLKSIWLNNYDYNLFMIGSSNFTSPALGIGERINYEANLVYGVSESRNKKGLKALNEGYLYPISEELDVEKLLFKNPINEESEEEKIDFVNLPGFFGEAVLSKNESQYSIELNFNLNSKIKKGFCIYTINNESSPVKRKIIYDEKTWHEAGQKNKVVLDWDEDTVPDYLEATWQDSEGKAFWPLIIENQITLPPVEELRNLPLESLIHILSSAQPLHRMLKIIEKYRKRKPNNHPDDAVRNALDLVDSSGFLLQRTRRVSYAMTALKERLEKPVFTIESLNWRLYGPVGVDSLKEAIVNEAKSDEEKIFLLSELALELSQVQPRTTEISLDQVTIKSAVKNVIKNLSNEIKLHKEDSPILMYSKEALRKALNEL
jgi:HKD family nuclease